MPKSCVTPDAQPPPELASLVVVVKRQSALLGLSFAYLAPVGAWRNRIWVKPFSLDVYSVPVVLNLCLIALNVLAHVGPLIRFPLLWIAGYVRFVVLPFCLRITHFKGL